MSFIFLKTQDVAQTSDLFLLCRYDHPYDEVCIAVVGKYTKLEDAYISVIKSLQHAALACKRKLVINVSKMCHWCCFIHFVKAVRFSTGTGNLTSSKLLCDKNGRWLHVEPGVPNVCNMLRNFQFDEYSVTLSQQLCCKTCLWLHVKRSGFTVPVTSEKKVVLPVRVQRSMCGRGLMGSFVLSFCPNKLIYRTSFLLVHVQSGGMIGKWVSRANWVI